MKVKKITKDSIKELLSKTPWDLDDITKFEEAKHKQLLEKTEYKLYLYRNFIKYEATEEAPQSVFYSFAFFILEPPKESKESYIKEIKKKEDGEDYDKEIIKSYIPYYNEAYDETENLDLPSIQESSYLHHNSNFFYSMSGTLNKIFDLDKQKSFNYYLNCLTTNYDIAVAYCLIEIKKLSEKKIKD